MKLARVTAHGLNYDIDPIELNAGSGTSFDGGLNMTPRPGKMVRALGYQAQWTIDDTPGAEIGALTNPYYLSYSPQLGDNFWVYAGPDKIATIDEGWNHNDITPTPGGLVAVGPGEWSGGNLNGIAVFNSPDNDPLYWFSGLNEAAVLPGLRTGTRYNVMRPHKYHLIGMGVTDGSGAFNDTVHWSDAADPGQIPQTWVPADDNEAGDNVLADETGGIIDGLSLRDSFFIYKQDSVYEMSYIGGNEVFRFTKVFTSSGAIAKNCIVRVKGTHVVLGGGDVYQHDGQNYRSLAEGRVKTQIFEAIDTVNFDRSFVAYLESENKVWICFPSQGQEWPDTAIIWDPETDAFGLRDIPGLSIMAPGVVGPAAVGVTESWDADIGTWDTDSTVWLQATIQQADDSLAMANPEPAEFYVANTGTLAKSESYRSLITLRGLDLGDPARLKGVRRIYPRINPADPDQVFTLEVLGQNSPAQDVFKSERITFVPGSEGLALDFNARYIGVRLWTDEPKTWDISGYDFHYVDRGLF